MDSSNFTPQESLQLITKVIEEARNRFTDNGFSFILWGSLSVVASIGQWILFQVERYEISFYPYFIMLLGGVVEYVYRSKKESPKFNNSVFRMITWMWTVIGANIFYLAFFLYWSLQNNISPLVLVLLSIGTIITGVSIRDRLVIFAGIELNLAGIICFYIDWEYHPLVMAVATLFGILIPGIILRYRAKNK